VRAADLDDVPKFRRLRFESCVEPFERGDQVLAKALSRPPRESRSESRRSRTGPC
jgi:hypothetical protein